MRGITHLYSSCVASRYVVGGVRCLKGLFLLAWSSTGLDAIRLTVILPREDQVELSRFCMMLDMMTVAILTVARWRGACFRRYWVCVYWRGGRVIVVDFDASKDHDLCIGLLE